MKLSTKWLNEFVSLDEITPEEVAQKLTMGSFEVEEIQKVGATLQGPILIGKILDIQKHPNADKLTVVRVTTDGNNELVIVCGAKNIQTGQIVPVSLPGAVVVNRIDRSKLLIKTTKIRGIESNGMLCSRSELGLQSTDQDQEGILILPQDAPLGQTVIEYLSLGEDTVMEVASRSNRGDALSVWGLSKEISALTKKKQKELKFKEPKRDQIIKNITSKIENTEDTFLFYTVVIENVTVKESPPYLKNLLASVDIRSINNIVDITNYINITFGQPMHAYDRAKLKGTTLTARAAKEGEKLLTIDEKTRELKARESKARELKEGVLVIADNSGPVAIAGIMGGKESEVTETTKDIVFEAAVFHPKKVRRGSRTIGLTTEASKRFERGVDTNFTYKSLLKAIELTEELACSSTKVKIGPINLAGEPYKKEPLITLLKEEVDRVLGIKLGTNEIKELLEPLGFKTKSLSEKQIEILVPTTRANDVTRPVDLIEEVARLYGYDRIPPLPPPSSLSSESQNNTTSKIKNLFLGAGFSETYLSSLIGEHILGYDDFPLDKTKIVSMLNPLSQEHSILRQSLLPGLLEAAKLNQSYKITPIRLFEIGKVYLQDNSNSMSQKETGVLEVIKLAGIASGTEENWFTSKNLSKSSPESLFFKLKGIIETLFKLAHLEVKFSLKMAKEKFLHTSLRVKIIYNNNVIGVLGCLHPLTEKKLDLTGPIILFELNLEPLILTLEKNKTFQKISSQPQVERDITIDLSKKYIADDIREEINKIISNFVRDINLISVYELDKDNRSLTYRLKMQDFEQTLTTKQIEDEITKIKNHLSACFQAKFRV